jgi:hypothetical protein
MDESRKWRPSQYAILLVVLALHLALVAALLMASATSKLSISSEHSVQLLYLPPVNLPKVRSENPRPRKLPGNASIPLATPVLDSLSLSIGPAPASSPVGSGSGVDWAAEARRALHAFEIRNHQPQVNRSISTTPGEDNWWPHAQHYAGEQFKTANGDWIVWINASCYQVAGSGPSPYALGALPRTVCLTPSSTGAK